MNNITTSFEQIKKLYRMTKHQKLKDIRFEFVMSILFPDIYDNIQKEIRRQHAAGYAEGLKASKEQDQ